MDDIILIGMPGSGKSTVGVVLAKALGMEFLDVDLLIQQREGALLQALIDAQGVERFLDLERDAICSLDCRGTVVAPGGSCVCREESIAHMRALGTVVYLELPLEDVAGIPGHCPLPRPDPGRRVPLPGPAVREVRPHHRSRRGPEPCGDGGSCKAGSGGVPRCAAVVSGAGGSRKTRAGAPARAGSCFGESRAPHTGEAWRQDDIEIE